MALPRVYRVCQDSNGNIVPGVLGSVLNHGTGVLAQLYNDAAGTQPLTNPMTSDATYGSFKFYVTPGHYDLTFSKPGYTFEPVYDFQVPDDNVMLGTMATQNAHAVAITGGSATLSTLVTTETATLQKGVNALNAAGSNVYGFVAQIAAAGGSNRFAFYSTSDAPSLFGGTVQVVGGLGAQAAPVATAALNLRWAKAGQDGIKFTPSDSDSGFAALQFLNTGGVPVGSISTTASATAYNTTSDARLKTAVAPLTGATAVVRQLRPITHLWRADGTRGYGFRADEVQQVLPDGGVVTGDKDAVDADGTIIPQQMDPGKLIPWLTAALQEALAALDTLTARVAVLEAARG